MVAEDARLRGRSIPNVTILVLVESGDVQLDVVDGGPYSFNGRLDVGPPGLEGNSCGLESPHARACSCFGLVQSIRRRHLEGLHVCHDVHIECLRDCLGRRPVTRHRALQSRGL